MKCQYCGSEIEDTDKGYIANEFKKLLAVPENCNFKLKMNEINYV